MMPIAKILATVFGIGYIRKGGGSVAALLFCILVYLIPPQTILMPVIALVLLLLGIWTSDLLERAWGKDSNRIVIDEVFGMCLSLVLVPLSLKSVLLAFVLFRFFDIVKPFWIRRVEALPKGYGVMADDGLAGLYTFLLMQLALRIDLI